VGKCTRSRRREIKTTLRTFFLVAGSIAAAMVKFDNSYSFVPRFQAVWWLLLFDGSGAKKATEGRTVQRVLL
jgi:hypothetical protein